MSVFARIVAVFVVVRCCFSAHAQSPQQAGGPPTFEGISISAPESVPVAFGLVRGTTPLPGSPFVRWFTTDGLGRVITFYVAGPAKDAQVAPEKLPVIVCVQGSGSQSVFARVEQGGKVLAGASGSHGVVRKLVKERAIIVVVEKPGVKFMECPSRPGSAEEGSKEFREEHMLTRWSAAVGAALRAALALPRADPGRVLVLGHSEGGLVACKVAADNPAVTHVATLAGGGPTQLFDLIELARSGVMSGPGESTEESRVRSLLDQWEEVLKEPESADLMFFGHPYRRWTSFLASSPVEELRKTRARVFIGQGTEDRAVVPQGADVLFASLRAVGRDVTYSRVAGDHGFAAAGNDGWLEMHQRALDWFFGE